MYIEEVLHVILVVFGDGNVVLSEDNAKTIHKGCLRHVDDIRAMGTQELRPGQILLEFLHRHERHHLLTVFQIDTHIVFQTLDKEDVIEIDTLQLVIGLTNMKRSRR